MSLGRERVVGRLAGARGKVAAALVVCAAVLGLTAGPASAILYQLPNGHYASYQALTGSTHNPTAPAPSGPAVIPGASNFEVFVNPLGYLNYSGGPVMTSSTNTVVVWQPSNYSGPAYGSGSFCGPGNNRVACTSYTQGVGTYFSDLAANSGSSTNSNSVAEQYIANGSAPNYNVSYGGIITDTNPLPADGCPGAPNVSGGRCLTDAQVQAELQTFLSSQGKPGGLTNEYFLLTPPGITSCFDTGGSVCSANAGPGGTVVFCAYHSRTSTSGRYVYSNIPDMDDIGGCDPFAFGSNADCNSLTCVWPNGWADGVLSAVSHEHNESITDPEPNNAWSDWGSGGNNRPIGDENGDKCNGDADADPDTNLQFDSNTFDYTPYNETINGRHYWIQREWSNQNLSCVNHWSTSGAIPGAAFQVKSQSGNTVNFDASGSCGNAKAGKAGCASIAQYVWQFNDNANPGQAPQNITVKTTNPLVSRTFPHPGTYTVALTTMGPNARSHAVSSNVQVVGTHCKVPNVVGKSLRKAKKAIKHANCSLGNVKGSGPKVVKQTPGPGTTGPKGLKVNVKLGH